MAVLSALTAEHSRLFAFFFCLMVIGVVGNVIVLCVYIKKRTSAINIFILSLSFIDVATCAIYMPYSIYNYYIVEQTEGTEFVSLLYICHMFSNIVFPTLVLSAIATERYLDICQPTLGFFSVFRAKITVIVLGLVAMVIILINATAYCVLYQRDRNDGYTHHLPAENKWNKANDFLEYSQSFYLSMCATCFIIITILYLLIMNHMRFGAIRGRLCNFWRQMQSEENDDHRNLDDVIASNIYDTPPTYNSIFAVERTSSDLNTIPMHENDDHSYIDDEIARNIYEAPPTYNSIFTVERTSNDLNTIPIHENLTHGALSSSLPNGVSPTSLSNDESSIPLPNVVSPTPQPHDVSPTPLSNGVLSTDESHGHLSLFFSHNHSSTDLLNGPSSTDTAHGPSSTNLSHGSSTDSSQGPSTTGLPHGPSSAGSSRRPIAMVLAHGVTSTDLSRGTSSISPYMAQHDSTATQPETPSEIATATSSEYNANFKLTKMMIIVTLVSFLTLLPSFLSLFGVIHSDKSPLVFYASNVFKPFIYTFMSKSFRRDFKDLIYLN